MSVPQSKLEQVRAMIREGKIDQACAVAQRLVQSAPRDAQAAAVLAEAHFYARRMPQALHFAKAAADLAPRDAAILCQYAYLLTVDYKGEQAAEVAERAVALNPAWDHARMTATGAYGLLRRFTTVIEHARAGLAANPGHAGLTAVLAGALTNAARADEGYALVRAALHADPGDHVLCSAACVIGNYVPGLSRQESLDLHASYGRLLERELPAERAAFANTPEAQRPLRVGLVSPDLRAHPVATFIEPLLAGHDRDRIKVYIYQTNMISDAVTQRLKQYPVAWRLMDTTNDVGLARAIRDDAIDVLVDLSGHTEAHSLIALHLRPAPVIATYCGYPGTTGVSGVGYRIVDALTDPPGDADAFATEKLVRIDPCFLCYRPHAEMPPVAPRAAGPITFGSFNALQKVNTPLINLWARVLERVPGSRLALKSMNLEDEGVRTDLMGRLEQAGIAPERVELIPPTRTIPQHLAAYARIDIALDTFPYHGTTTTCEAICMGVPVITLAGDRHASRVGVSLLHAIGLPECVAGDEETYVNQAAALATDEGRLAALRETLRPRLLASPLCDEAAFCRRFEETLRAMWRTWCEGERA